MLIGVNMNTLAINLKNRLEKEFGIENIIPEIHRTRAGYWQRAEGAWSWFMMCKDNTDVGSQWSATKVLKAKRLSITYAICQNTIDVEEEE